MTDAKIVKEIYDRIDGLDIPRDPLEFQRLVHNDLAIEGIDGLTGKIDEQAVPGYYGLNLLLKGYCDSCKLENSCDWNTQVKRAAGENYPFWLMTWPTVEYSSLRDDDIFPDSKLVMCTHYQSEELERKGVPALQQPLVRLIDIIELNR